MTVDEAYVIESVRDPAAKLVETFTPVMVPYDANAISDNELQAFIAFLKEDAAE